MEDLLLKEAREKGLADERGLYIACNVVRDGAALGRVWAFLKETRIFLCDLEFPAGLGRVLQTLELEGARAEVVRFLIPVALILDTQQGHFELRGFRDAKKFLEAVREICEK